MVIQFARSSRTPHRLIGSPEFVDRGAHVPRRGCARVNVGLVQRQKVHIVQDEAGKAQLHGDPGSRVEQLPFVPRIAVALMDHEDPEMIRQSD